MALATIKPTNATTAVTINSVVLTTMMDTAEPEITAPVENETVFSNEASGGAYSTGTETIVWRFRGPLKYGAAGAKPLTPSTAQDKTYDVLWVTGCEITGTLSVTRARISNVAGTARRVEIDAIGTGAYVFTWAVA